MYAHPSISWSSVFWTGSSPRLQPFLIVAGDALVALRQRDQLLAADDIVNVLERLIAGAAIDFVQDRVGWRLAVRQHHFARRRQALGFVSLKCRDRIGVGNKSTRQSSMACAAPLAPRGYIGCAASPNSVRRPKLQRSNGS